MVNRLPTIAQPIVTFPKTLPGVRNRKFFQLRLDIAIVLNRTITQTTPAD